MFNYDFAQVNKILALTGPAWSKHFNRPEVLKSTIAGLLELDRQAQQDLAEGLACRDRYRVPVYHTQHWVPLPIVRVGGNSLTFHIPEQLVSLPLIVNRINHPSLLWQEGIDYKIDTGHIEFKNDPFEIDLIAKIDMGAGFGTVLWGIGAQFELEYMYSSFAAPLGLPKGSGELYNDTINAIIDCLLLGTTTARLETVLTLLQGVPVVQTAQECVETLSEDRRGPFVATDVKVYRLPEGATACVLEGQRLDRGTPLAKVVKITEFNENSSHNVVIQCLRQPVDQELIRRLVSPSVKITFFDQKVCLS